MNSSYGVAAGCSAICDTNGNLLFFTNGEVVYNTNGNAMPHGNNLGGSANAIQGSLIIPHPGNNNLYYLFTTDAQIGIFTGGCGCVSYSLIDMQQDSGRGDVIDSIKAIQLYGPATSRLAGVLSKNSNTYWIITHSWNNNIFFVYKVDSMGLDTNPLIIPAGSVYNDTETFAKFTQEKFHI
jgi:hypothetical protein